MGIGLKIGKETVLPGFLSGLLLQGMLAGLSALSMRSSRRENICRVYCI
jgi:hypothetical protein